jgi:hypothetical protein
VAGLRELDEFLEAASTEQFLEIWVHHEHYPALCALVNGDLGWLMVFRFDGDTGRSSRNPSYSVPEAAEVEYYLSNGQCDVFPAAWSYAREDIFSALRYFAKNKCVPSWLSWSKESDDGVEPHSKGTV